MIKVEIQREVSGYLLGDYFISKNAWECLTDIPPKGKEEKGLLYNGIVVVNNKEYKDIKTLLNKENFYRVLQIFEESGIVIRKFLYIKMEGNLSTLSDLNLDSFWEKISYPFVYVINDTQQGKEIGYMLTLDDIYEYTRYESMYIGMFEIFKKGKHIGTEVIKDLKTYRTRVKGLATTKSKPFWTKLGAKYLEDEVHFYLE